MYRGRGGGRGFGRKFRPERYDDDDDDGNSGTSFKRPKPPRHGQRGRGRPDIGLYYKNLHKDKKERRTETIPLRIPGPIITKLISNLASITNVAKKENIKIHPQKLFIPVKNGHAGDADDNIVDEIEISDDDYDNSQLRKSKDHARDAKENIVDEKKMLGKDTDNNQSSKSNDQTDKCIDPKPSTSTDIPSVLPDFIPVNSESSEDLGEETKLLGLRGAGDYKYGYDDIITGSFSEKLEENLSKGINILKSNDEISSLNLVYYEEFMNMKEKAQYKKMMQFRETLPTYKKREELLHAINNNQVVVISGETGCGKSTQVPQLILDDAILNKKGANCKILITQPRRIAASSLSLRVASERAESVGNSVGYAVRLEKIEARPRCSMMFCTTGVLLVDLETRQGLTDYSHIILDEVHERDSFIDFAMCMLKQVLQKRKDLKLILMSATLDAEKLTAYFDSCPLLHIEGLAYPVKDIYLEEILHMTKFELEPAPPPRQPTKPYQKHLKFFKRAARVSEAGEKYRQEIEGWLRSRRDELDHRVYETLLDHRIEVLNVDLIFAVIKHICRGPPGAILVFVPGIVDITKIVQKISENESYLASKCQVYALHSKLPSLEQHKIFDRPPAGIRKIVVATNIAETSITIDDIVYVIDTGKIKYHGLNVENYLSTLNVEWVSQANLRQRRGRAGRCQPGICYHLISTFRANQLEERLLPELQRNNLLEPVLTIKRLRLGKVAEALRNVPDPPAETTINSAVKHLQQCGALDDNEVLTPLGWHLARLPLHPTAGKLVLLGALFGCVDRAVSVAAVWSFKDPFILSLDQDEDIKARKRELACGEPSDHVAISEAIIQWERSRYKREFAYENFLSTHTLELLHDMKNQIGSNLKEMGFLNSGDVKSKWENRNSNNLSLFKAIVAASLYPNIGRVKWTSLNSRDPNKQVKVKVRIQESPYAQIHPSSLMVPSTKSRRAVKLCSNPGAKWLVYWLKQKSSDVFLLEVTLVYTLPLLFFGELKVYKINSESCFVFITAYQVKMYNHTAELLLKLRNLLDQVLASKITSSSKNAIQHSQFEEKVLNAVIDVITAEDEQLDYVSESDNYSNSETE